MILIKSFLTGVLYDYFKLIYAYLNEGRKVHECYSCFKMIAQANLHAFLVVFFSISIIKHVLIKRFYIYKKLAIKYNF